MHSPVHSRPARRALQVAFLLGALAFILNSLHGSAKVRRDRRQQSEALQTWEGEGGAPRSVPMARLDSDGLRSE
jgi:hypothetical protein